MSGDDAYTSFLDKANADLDAGRQQQAAPSAATATRADAVDADEPVPAALAGVEAFYVSETDEPFEPVVMRWGVGEFPDECTSSVTVTRGGVTLERTAS
jgi:hypothetical protein